MSRFYSLRTPGALLIVLLALVSGVWAARAAPAPQLAAPYQLFLPLVAQAGIPPSKPPPQIPTPSGFFALTNWLTYNAATVVDANGGVHLAYSVSNEKHEDDPSSKPAIYTYCPGPVSACADPNTWSELVNLDERVNEVQIAVTPDGRPRMLVRRDRTDQNWSEYLFYACEQQCTDPKQWSGLLVAQPAGLDLYHYDTPQHSFALDAQGRPRFIFSNGWGNGKPDGIFYAYCDAADCTRPGTWSAAPMMEGLQYNTVTAGYASLVFDGTTPHVLIMRELSGFADGLYYFVCETAECSQTADWQNTRLAHPEGKQWANWDLALGPTGQPRIALYEAASIDIYVGGRLFYASCDQSCLAGASNWSFTQVAAGEGKNVDLAIDLWGRMHLVYDAGQRGVLGELWCDVNCTTAAQWQRRLLQTSEQLLQEFAPASPLACNQQARVWLDAIPTVVFDKQGQLVVAYDVKNVATCYYGNPTPGLPPGSRVERLWWAVRWDTFTQP